MIQMKNGNLIPTNLRLRKHGEAKSMEPEASP